MAAANANQLPRLFEADGAVVGFLVVWGEKRAELALRLFQILIRPALRVICHHLRLSAQDVQAGGIFCNERPDKQAICRYWRSAGVEWQWALRQGRLDGDPFRLRGCHLLDISSNSVVVMLFSCGSCPMLSYEL